MSQARCTECKGVGEKLKEKDRYGVCLAFEWSKSTTENSDVKNAKARRL